MWAVNSIESVAVKLDFTSSGQGLREATAIFAEGTQLFNALELVEYHVNATQVKVCECCGFAQCQPGGWVTFRRVGDAVICIPAWSELDLGKWESGEYTPPGFLGGRGLPLIGASVWAELRKIHRGLPDSVDIPKLNSRETVLVIQWSAQGQVLGVYPNDIKLRREFVIAVADGDVTEEADVTDDFLKSSFVDPVDVELESSSVGISPIEFFLDLPGFPRWSGLARIDGDVVLLIDQDLALRRSAS